MASSADLSNILKYPNNLGPSKVGSALMSNFQTSSSANVSAEGASSNQLGGSRIAEALQKLKIIYAESEEITRNIKQQIKRLTNKVPETQGALLAGEEETEETEEAEEPEDAEEAEEAEDAEETEDAEENEGQSATTTAAPTQTPLPPTNSSKELPSVNGELQVPPSNSNQQSVATEIASNQNEKSNNSERVNSLNFTNNQSVPSPPPMNMENVELPTEDNTIQEGGRSRNKRNKSRKNRKSTTKKRKSRRS